MAQQQDEKWRWIFGRRRTGYIGRNHRIGDRGREDSFGGTKEKEDDDDSFPRVARHGRYLLLAMDDGVWCPYGLMMDCQLIVDPKWISPARRARANECLCAFRKTKKNPAKRE